MLGVKIEPDVVSAVPWIRRVREAVADIMHKFLDWIFRHITATDTTLTEFWNSTLLIFVGIWLILPFNTFTITPVYDHMEKMAPEAVWGAVMIALGLFQTWGNIKKKTGVRRVAAFLSSVFVGFICWLAVISAPASLLAPVFGSASFVQSLVYLRLSFLEEHQQGVRS